MVGFSHRWKTDYLDAAGAAEPEAAGAAAEAAGAEAAGAAEPEAAGAAEPEAAGAEPEAAAEPLGASPILHAVRARAIRPAMNRDFFILSSLIKRSDKCICSNYWVFRKLPTSHAKAMTLTAL